MKFQVVFGFLVCVLAFGVIAGNPKFPKSVVCSITGTGNITFNRNGHTVYVGNGTMKRVNTVALYLVRANRAGERNTVNFTYLIRPELGGCGRNFMYCGNESNGLYSRIDGAKYYKYTDYKYVSSFKPIANLKDYNAFLATSTVSVDHAFLFRKTDDKLIAEWFRVRHLDVNISLVYDSLEVFHHDKPDDAFDLDVESPYDYMSNSELAVSTKCVQKEFEDSSDESGKSGKSDKSDQSVQSGGFTISAPWLLIMFVLSVLSFALF